MSEHFSDRTRMMLGDEGYELLRRARVAIFGIGGVGGYAVEALARAGVGALDLIDSDKVSVSNINRQIIATASTVGKYKTEAAAERIRDINPDCKVTSHTLFYSTESAEQIDLSSFDYIIDAIDSVSSKIELICRAQSAGIPIISAMGAGNKLDPTRFRVADISKTSVCPLAKAVRVALRKRGINHLKVVFSDEPPVNTAKRTLAQPEVASSQPETAVAEPEVAASQPKISMSQPKSAPKALEITAKAPEIKTLPATYDETSAKKAAYDTRTPPGSISFVPSVMGLILAGEVIKELSGIGN